ncbi:hypothetical protein NE857_00290 [Nocardiopsis exhalans]|uniref:Uncharacterized protein n=1 Tax=Nocardiopsis exhalans TaxID=163604 RepID=A0ABY5DAS0_9ACTN|nr:hypothetical protein [Nocardiopsis exhalans]USY20158.1 hypothetical protein NE857_00290 [Nocardiopsis exhalans]
MSTYPTDLSTLTGPELVRAFLDAYDKPRTTKAERAEFFDFKSRIFAAIAERDGNPDAARFVACAKADSDLLWAEIAASEVLNGGEA